MVEGRAVLAVGYDDDKQCEPNPTCQPSAKFGTLLDVRDLVCKALFSGKLLLLGLGGQNHSMEQALTRPPTRLKCCGSLRRRQEQFSC
ncbi:hypothetical protein MPLA_750037 [Mesorhizobium sp. ORS 3359]|nr:hypothetical protein MPLA_750037 [Mesorhizobium sp. ORS 3359]